MWHSLSNLPEITKTSKPDTSPELAIQSDKMLRTGDLAIWSGNMVSQGEVDKLAGGI